WSRQRFTMDEGMSKAVLKVFVDLYREGLIYKDERLVNWDPKLLTAISDLEVQQVETNGHLWHFRYRLAEGETYPFPIAFDASGNPRDWEQRDYITVATTRPETMLGDTGVAVHPDDERYKDLVGKTVLLPLVGREIPIVADEYADPEQGSGAVKITPAHDFNDFEVGRRQNLEMINIFDEHACISIEENRLFWENTLFAERLGGAEEVVREIGGRPKEDVSKYVRYKIDHPKLIDLKDQLDELRCLGDLDRFVARERIVEMMEARGLVEKTEEHAHVVPYGDRSNVVIEPWLTEQWYVDAATLAKPAIAAVEKGDTVFVPKNWEKTYFEWMRNIQPWCISRQLWWGHQIPAWYGPGDDVFKHKIFCELSKEEAISAAKSHYGRPVEIVDKAEFRRRVFLETTWPDGDGKSEFKGRVIPLTRDPDVLDTWFSSALWPFSTLGWPEETPELARYYKTDVLVTGFDIIFFWVARMMMMGLHFMRDEKGRPEVPFHTVYIHALVRDESGAKMSKSKGNVMDPLEMADEFGADALRFTLAAMAAQGRDIKLAKARVEGYRNFGTKIWNASRFLEMNKCVRVEGFDPGALTLGVNKWIVGEVEKAAHAVTGGIEAYRFNEAASALYRFVWNIFCDWYLELIKPSLQGDDEASKAETRATAAWVLDRSLSLLHPFMPFITEELWTRLGETGPPRRSMLILAEWPEMRGLVNAQAEAEFDWVIRVVSEIRSLRAEMNMPAGARIPVTVLGAGEATRARLEANRDALMTLARLESISPADTAPNGSSNSEAVGQIKGSVQFVLDEATFALPLEGVIDISAETDRLNREIAKAGSEIAQIEAKLGNEKFTSRAPAHVVEEQRRRKADAEAVAAKLNDALKRLKAAI
ncbi:MAG TPA: valine--tRNA ligase, partial [Rhizobiales bacterium]|nr:valine--tRNA ligase [Hyphomicrobiales bacterium]